MNPERQLLFPIQEIQIFQTNLFKGLGGEVMEVFRNVAIPNAINIVIFQISQVAVGKSVPETEEVIGQNILTPQFIRRTVSTP